MHVCVCSLQCVFEWQEYNTRIHGMVAGRGGGVMEGYFGREEGARGGGWRIIRFHSVMFIFSTITTRIVLTGFLLLYFYKILELSPGEEYELCSVCLCRGNTIPVQTRQYLPHTPNTVVMKHCHLILCLQSGLFHRDKQLLDAQIISWYNLVDWFFFIWWIRFGSVSIALCGLQYCQAQLQLQLIWKLS